MLFRTTTSPHLPPATRVNKVMLNVLMALLPGTAAMIYFMGWGVLVNIILAISFALLFEACCLLARKRPVMPFLSDYSAIVTARLFALTIPPTSAWWITFVGILFAIVVAKHVYGGLGYNPFNPAMVGYVVVIVSFPTQLTLWSMPQGLEMDLLSLGETLKLQLLGQLPEQLSWDSLTMATPLDSVKTNVKLGQPINDIYQQPGFGLFAGYGWEWINLGFLVGGIYLLIKKTINWHVPVGLIAGLAVISFLFFIVDTSHSASPLFHLVSGGTMLGAFFIATDPVSGSTTNRGRLIFAAGVGVLTYIIRTWGGYPDGIAFAVLFMNLSTPLIDQYTQPRVFGQGKKS